MQSKNRGTESTVSHASCDFSKPVTIILALGRHLIRAGVRSMLQDAAGILIVGETSEWQELLHLIGENRPETVLIDNALSGLNGPGLSAKIKNDFPDVRIIMLSSDNRAESVCRAIHCGASAYLLTDTDSDELCVAIHSAMKGSTYISASVSRLSFTDILSGQHHTHRELEYEDGSLDSLSSRHREILRMIVEGDTLKKIALQLNLSVKTVEVYRRQIMDRLGVQTLRGLVRYAMRQGIIR